MRLLAFLLAVLALPLLTLATTAAASRSGTVTIETQKPFGPSLGTFSAVGALTDSGTFANTDFLASARGAPGFGIVHATQRFDGSLGSFTLRVNVTFTLTDNPNVALDEGTWVVLDGTGAYATLRGQGRITGTEDEAADLIQRTYTGTLELG
jgi:hypothetical protein